NIELFRPFLTLIAPVWTTYDQAPDIVRTRLKNILIRIGRANAEEGLNAQQFVVALRRSEIGHWVEEIAKRDGQALDWHKAKDLLDDALPSITIYALDELERRTEGFEKNIPELEAKAQD